MPRISFLPLLSLPLPLLLLLFLILLFFLLLLLLLFLLLLFLFLLLLFLPLLPLFLLPIQKAKGHDMVGRAVPIPGRARRRLVQSATAGSTHVSQC